MKQFNNLTVYTDGGSRGNPGPAAVGVVICSSADSAFVAEATSAEEAALAKAGGGGRRIVKEYGEYLGEMTNNEAEYRAVVFALKKLKHLIGKKKTKMTSVEILSDSELLVSQLNGKYKIKEDRIAKLFIEIWNLKVDFGEVRFLRVPREENKEADKLVNQVLDRQRHSLF